MNWAWIAGIIAMLAVVWTPWSAGVAVMGLVASMLGLIWSMHRPERVRLPVVTAGAMALAGIGMWQLVTGSTLYGFGTEVRVAAWGAAAWTMFLAANGRGNAEELRDGLLWLGVCVAVLGVFHSLTAEGQLWWSLPAPAGMRPFAPFVNVDHFAMFLELVAPMAAANLVAGRREVFSTCSLGVMTGAAVATGSRAGAAAVVLTLVVLLVVRVAQRRNDWTAAGLVVLATAMVLAAGWERVWMKLQVEDQMATRRELNVVSKGLLDENGWKGTGLGTWRYAYAAKADPKVPGDVEAAHNDWLQTGVEAGWGGLMVLGMMGAWCVYRCWRRPWGWGTVLLLGHATVDFPLQTPTLLFMWALVAGLLGAEAEKKERRERVSALARR